MALDERAIKLLKTAINHSLKIKPGDKLLIQSDHTFINFANEATNLAQKRGATTELYLFDLERQRDLIKNNRVVEQKAINKRKSEMADNATAYLNITSLSNPNYLSGVDPKLVQASMERLGGFTEKIFGNNRDLKPKKWVTTSIPCQAEADNARMSLKDYEDFLYHAMDVNWEETSKCMNQVKEIFDSAKDVHIIVPGLTDLHLNIENRLGKICDGEHNLPDGEVFYGPQFVEGHITFPYTTRFKGNNISGISFEYEHGTVKNFSAKENQETLTEAIKLGAKYVGEFGIGCNKNIKQHTNNALFDEKINGTIHLGTGRPCGRDIQNGGGQENYAQIHWDLVSDLRKNSTNPGGEIRVDGKTVQKNGIWVFE